MKKLYQNLKKYIAATAFSFCPFMTSCGEGSNTDKSLTKVNQIFLDDFVAKLSKNIDNNNSVEISNSLDEFLEDNNYDEDSIIEDLEDADNSSICSFLKYKFPFNKNDIFTKSKEVLSQCDSTIRLYYHGQTHPLREMIGYQRIIWITKHYTTQELSYEDNEIINYYYRDKDRERIITSQLEVFLNLCKLLKNKPDMPVFIEGLAHLSININEDPLFFIPSINSCDPHDIIKEFLDEHDLWQRVNKNNILTSTKDDKSEDTDLIIDDTIISKPYRKETKHVCWHYNHASGKCEKGIGLITCLLRNSQFATPINYRIIDKTKYYKDKKTSQEKRKSSVTKNEHFKEILEESNKKLKGKFKYVLADNWFCSKSNLDYIHNKIKKH